MCRNIRARHSQCRSFDTSTAIHCALCSLTSSRTTAAAAAAWWDECGVQPSCGSLRFGPEPFVTPYGTCDRNDGAYSIHAYMSNDQIFRVGQRVERGYYPAGGGSMHVSVTMAGERLLPLDLMERGSVTHVACSVYGAACADPAAAHALFVRDDCTLMTFFS
jgi:hypothetical protein